MTKIYHLLFAALLFCLAHCETTETKLDSDNYENSTERVEILSRAIKTFSPIKDAEFELFNVNGFNNGSLSTPGASSWDYKFVVKVDTADVYKWCDGMTEVSADTDDNHWNEDIIQNRKANWQTSGIPRYYERTGQDVTMIVYHKDGLIFKRVIMI
jgi:hypothetical protein